MLSPYLHLYVHRQSGVDEFCGRRSREVTRCAHVAHTRLLQEGEQPTSTPPPNNRVIRSCCVGSASDWTSQHRELRTCNLICLGQGQPTLQLCFFYLLGWLLANLFGCLIICDMLKAMNCFKQSDSICCSDMVSFLILQFKRVKEETGRSGFTVFMFKHVALMTSLHGDNAWLRTFKRLAAHTYKYIQWILDLVKHTINNKWLHKKSIR